MTAPPNNMNCPPGGPATLDIVAEKDTECKHIFYFFSNFLFDSIRCTR